MRLQHVSDIEDFIDVVKSCEGAVWIEAPDGERISLRSRFSRYIAIGVMAANAENDYELFCSTAADEAKFFKFFEEHPGVN
jgi:hypothetical protein